MGAALAAAYSLRVARLVWLGEGHTPDPGEPAPVATSDEDEPTAVLEPATAVLPVTQAEDVTKGDELTRAELLPGAVLALAVLALGIAPVLVLAVTDPALAAVVTR